MSKLRSSAIRRFFLRLLISIVPFSFVACGDSDVYIEGVVYEGSYGYMGDQVAGRAYTATHVELGIRSGNFFEVTPGSLQLSFNNSALFVAGNKNCNSFQAESVWYEFSLAFRFTVVENQLCPIELVGFPENVYLDDIFEMEVYFELGRQVVVLYSEQQDVAIYLN